MFKSLKLLRFASDTQKNFKADYYKILNVPHDANEKQIKDAYRNLARIYHPDKNNGVETIFYKKATDAYQVLSDPNNRSKYDEKLRNKNYTTGGAGSSSSGQTKKDEEQFDSFYDKLVYNLMKTFNPEILMLLGGFSLIIGIGSYLKIRRAKKKYEQN